MGGRQGAVELDMGDGEVPPEFQCILGGSHRTHRESAGELDYVVHRYQRLWDEEKKHNFETIHFFCKDTTQTQEGDKTPLQRAMEQQMPCFSEHFERGPSRLAGIR